MDVIQFDKTGHLSHNNLYEDIVLGQSQYYKIYFESKNVQYEDKII